MKLDIECLKNNIRKLTKMNNITIKDLESKIGVGEGYISRRNPSNGTDLGAILESAEILGVSLSTLIDTATADILESDIYTVKVLDKLIELSYKWHYIQMMSPDEIDAKATVDGEFISEICDACINDMQDAYPLYKYINDSIVIKSEYHPWVKIQADSIPLEYSNGNTSLFLHRFILDNKTEYELYLYNEGKLEQLAHTCNRQYINNRLITLYNEIINRLAETEISNDAKQCLDNLLF